MESFFSFATHKVFYPLISGCLPLEFSFHKRFSKFVKAGLFGPSAITAIVMRVACNNPSSVFARNMSVVSHLYNFDQQRIRTTDLDRFFVRQWQSKSEDKLEEALVLRELMLVRADGGSIWSDDEDEEMSVILATQ